MIERLKNVDILIAIENKLKLIEIFHIFQLDQFRCILLAVWTNCKLLTSLLLCCFCSIIESMLSSFRFSWLNVRITSVLALPIKISKSFNCFHGVGWKNASQKAMRNSFSIHCIWCIMYNLEKGLLWRVCFFRSAVLHVFVSLSKKTQM